MESALCGDDLAVLFASYRRIFQSMLTVLFATRNGAKTLPTVLNAYTQLEWPDSGWKLVIIDNGSTDNTKEVIQNFRGLLPLTYEYEGVLGKNAALNTGLKFVEGDLVVLTDDDVYPRPDWLVTLRTSADAQQRYSIFGGVILPRWEVPPPHWIAWTRQSAMFAITNPAFREGPVTDGIFGPNMAIRTAVFEDGIRFDVLIGPRGPAYAMGSETELIQRLLRQGHNAWHIQGAVVEHFIRDYQLKKPWVLSRAIRLGRGEYRLSQSDGFPAGVQYWMGVPRFLFRAIVERGILLVLAWISLNEKRRFCARWEFNYQLGKIIEARILNRERQST